MGKRRESTPWTGHQSITGLTQTLYIYSITLTATAVRTASVCHLVYKKCGKKNMNQLQHGHTVTVASLSAQVLLLYQFWSCSNSYCGSCPSSCLAAYIQMVSSQKLEVNNILKSPQMLEEAAGKCSQSTISHVNVNVMFLNRPCFSVDYAYFCFHFSIICHCILLYIL